MKKSTTIFLASSICVIILGILTVQFFLNHQKSGSQQTLGVVTSTNLNVDYPNNLQSISWWVTSTVPNTSIRFKYPPLLRNENKFKMFIGQDGDYFRVAVIPNDLQKLVSSTDYDALDEYCNFPYFSMKIIKRDPNIKTIRDAVSVEAQKENFASNDYIGQYGLYTSINGKDIFFYKFTEDNGYYFAIILLKDYILNLGADAYGPCVDRSDSGDTTLTHFAGGKAVFGWFDFVNILKGIAYLN